MFKKLVALAFTSLFIMPALLLAATPVNVNTADATAIAKALDRIGQAKAQAIVSYREAHGPFKKVDDLGHVKGIGKATIELNRSAILLADESADAAAPATAAATPAEAPAKPVHKSKKAAVPADKE
ncbi:helix-hairpin-helix domain-containing protein [Rhodanobacter sp. L36]|uniref:ComEA family DNA-binding protein n=1 Tax=Rhodanobacter sp. L36 TaxID=1747221 RepID=UPI00131E2522|nr:helix-hairpin-helix domain-containing protein [Rhodanobacter sp. L36]